MSAKLIRIVSVERQALDVRSSGDARHRVDAYFVCYFAQWPDGDTGDWVCRFEVPRGAKFVPTLYPTQKEALAAKGYTL